MEHVTIDIGASSGKILSGKLVDGRLECQVVYRFPNGYAEKDGHLVWDVDGLFHQTLLGLQEARRQGINPSTIAIDTWGCDYVLLDEQGMLNPDLLTAPADVLLLPMTDDFTAAVELATRFRNAGLRAQIYSDIPNNWTKPSIC